MSEKLSFLFELADRVSSPARDMEKAVKGVESALGVADKRFKDVDKSVKDLDKHLRDLEAQAKKTRLEKTTDPLKKQRLELQLNRLALRNQRDEALLGVKALKSQKKGLEEAAGANKGYTLGADIMSGVIQRAIGGLAELAMKGVELGVAGAKFATDAIAFKEQTLTALKVMTGTEASAQRIFNDALQFAKKTPFETRDVLSGFTQLLGAGFKESEVTTVFAAIGDAAAASGFDQQVIDRMVVAFAQIKAKGRLMGQEMLQVNEALGRAGVGTTAIYDQMAKKLGKTRLEVMKLQEAGKIDSDTAIFSIIKALEQKSGGAVGNLMAEQSKTLTGLLSTLKSAPGDFFMSLDMKNLPGFDALKGFVSNLVKLFDTGSKAGQRLQVVAGKLYNTVMVALFGGLDTDKGLGRMESIIIRTANAVEGMLPSLGVFLGVLKGFGGGFIEGLLPSLERFGGVSSALFGPDSGKTAEAFGESMGKLAGKLLGVADAVLVLLEPLVRLVELFEREKVLLDASVAVAHGNNWGQALMDGISLGIYSKAATVFEAIRAVTTGASNTYKTETETHSPSRLFARYGAWATEGWAMGVTSGIPDAEAAVDALVGASSDGASAGTLSLGGGSGAGSGAGALGMGGTTIVNVTVPLQVPAGASDDAVDWAQRAQEVLARLLPGALEEAFSMAAAQKGAA